MRTFLKSILLLSIFLVSSSAFLFFTRSVAYSQGRICTGSVSYSRYNCDYNPASRRYSCENNGTSTVGCSGGGVEYCRVAVSGGCSASSSGCNVTTNTVGCSSYTPPAPPVAPAPQPQPSTNPSGSPDPSASPTTSYYCDTCSGTCVAGGGSSIQACQASCYVDLNTCGGGTGPDPGDPNAGQSSCPAVQELTTVEMYKPGETKAWTTWAKPAGSTATERLLNPSPVDPITLSYTSPGNMITFAYKFILTESQPHTFYMYDSTEGEETFYFFQNDNEPAVVFSKSQAVVDRAVEIGYTLIDPNQTSYEESKSFPRRVYKLNDVGEDTWEDDSGIFPVTRHAPFNKTLYHIPYVSCASLMNASSRQDKYSTNLPASGYNNAFHCMRRQPIPLREPKDDEEDEFTEQIMLGNYLGMENDWGRPDWVIGNDDRQVWPRTNLYVNADLFKYGPTLKYSAMEKNAYYRQRPNSSRAEFIPGFVRQAIVQIPTELFIDPYVSRTFYAQMDLGGGDSTLTPIEDENSSRGCPGPIKYDICDPNENWECRIPDRYDTEPAGCQNIKLVVKNSDKVISPGGKVKTGETYTITSNVNAESTLYDFYNNHFNAPKITSSTIDNWNKTDDIDTFSLVDCGGSWDCIPNNEGDTKVLRVSQNPNANQSANGVHSGYIDTGSNITGKTFRVSFWARVESSSTKTIPQIIIEREGYVSPTARNDFKRVLDPADSRDVRFPVPNTANSTTSSITVNNEWKRFVGTVTFNYDTTNYTGHPQGSLSTKFKIILRAPADGTKILYDNIDVDAWEQPTVYYRMASALTPSQNSSFNQCSQSTHAGETFTNLSGGLFWADITIPEDRTPGNYNIFSAFESSPGKVLFGNPEATTNCGLNRSEWDDTIADTCHIEVEVISCEDTTPLPPSVTNVGSDVTNLPTPPASGFNDFRVTDNQLSIIAATTGNNTQKAAVTAMDLFIEPYNSSNPSAPSDAATIIEGVKSGVDSFVFTFDLDQNNTNELSIYMRSINENACNESGELLSSWYKRNIRLMRQRSGYLINIPKEEYNTYNCRDTKESLVGRGQSDRLVDLTPSDPDEPSFTTLQLTVNTVGTFNPIVAAYSSTFGQFKALSLGSVSNYYITDLPYNPPNTTSWRNNITSFTLDLPPHTTEESYVCLENCNPNIGTDSNPRCQAAGSISNPYMVVPKPQYPGYPHPQYQNDLNIYVGKGNFNDAWWQSRGGLVFANGSINSDLPYFGRNPRALCQAQIAADVCIPFINARSLITPGTLSADRSAGFLVTNGNSITNGSTVTTSSWRTQNQEASEPTVMSSAITSSVMNAEDYDYFWNRIDESKVTALGANLTSKPTGAVQYDPNENVRVYRRGTNESPQNLDIDLGSNTIAVGANEKVIIFVTGNLNLYGGTDSQNMTNRITVSNSNGFLAFIVQGDITVGTNVGVNVVSDQPIGRTPVIKGIYLADGTIKIPSKGANISDKKFIVEGSFVGLNLDGEGGVQLGRKFDSGTTNIFDREKNSQSPVEQFIFSPSLVAATPNLLREANLTWEETN